MSEEYFEDVNIERFDSVDIPLDPPKGPGEVGGDQQGKYEVHVKPDIAHFNYIVYDNAVFLQHIRVINRREGIGSSIIDFLVEQALELNKDYVGGFIGGGEGTKTFLVKNGFSQGKFQFWTDDEWNAWVDGDAPKLSDFNDYCKSGGRVKKDCVNESDWPWGYSVWFLDKTEEVKSERESLAPIINRKPRLISRLQRRLK